MLSAVPESTSLRVALRRWKEFLSALMEPSAFCTPSRPLGMRWLPTTSSILLHGLTGLGKPRPVSHQRSSLIDRGRHDRKAQAEEFTISEQNVELPRPSGSRIRFALRRWPLVPLRAATAPTSVNSPSQRTARANSPSVAFLFRSPFRPPRQHLRRRPLPHPLQHPYFSGSDSDFWRCHHGL